jgi:hypothetical protein
MELLIAFARYFAAFSYLVVTAFVLVRSFKKSSLFDIYKLAFIALASFALAVLEVIK